MTMEWGKGMRNFGGSRTMAVQLSTIETTRRYNNEYSKQDKQESYMSHSIASNNGGRGMWATGSLNLI